MRLSQDDLHEMGIDVMGERVKISAVIDDVKRIHQEACNRRLLLDWRGTIFNFRAECGTTLTILVIVFVLLAC